MGSIPTSGTVAPSGRRERRGSAIRVVSAYLTSRNAALPDPPEGQRLTSGDACLPQDPADVVYREFAISAVCLNRYGARIAYALPHAVAPLGADMSVAIPG